MGIFPDERKAGFTFGKTRGIISVRNNWYREFGFLKK
jgi:hypothetical protein